MPKANQFQTGEWAIGEMKFGISELASGIASVVCDDLDGHDDLLLRGWSAGGAPSQFRRGLSGASTKKARRLWDGPRLAAVGSGRASVVCWRGPAARPRSGPAPKMTVKTRQDGDGWEMMKGVPENSSAVAAFPRSI
jgi:hypothetical protein